LEGFAVWQQSCALACFSSRTHTQHLLLLCASQGAEVIRMYYTLLGIEAFDRRLRNFFDTHYLQVC
jgi:hypothetical protein